MTKFAALGTYLANLRDEATRQRYTRFDAKSSRRSSPDAADAARRHRQAIRSRRPMFGTMKTTASSRQRTAPENEN